MTYVGRVAHCSGMEIGLARFIAATDAVDSMILAEERPLVQPGQVSEAGRKKARVARVLPPYGDIARRRAAR